MLRMEIALVLVLGFVAYMYDSAERTRTALHRTFSALLAATLVHLVFAALTLYTVNHLDSVPKWLNDGLHRLFVGTMVLVVYLFYQYIAILVEEESGKRGGSIWQRGYIWRLRRRAFWCCRFTTL